jgi:outer membrane lipoprotein-sorting protein
MGQRCMKKIVVTTSAIFFVITLSFAVCADEQQAPQEPFPPAGVQAPLTKEPLKGKAAVMVRIEKAVSTVQAVVSEFRQERRLAMLKEPVVSTGRIYYEKPDKLRWEYVSPDISGFLVNGKVAKQWKGKDSPPEALDLRKNPFMGALVDQILAWTKADFDWIEKRYAISVVAENPAVLKLVPKSVQEKKYIDHFLVSFEADTHYANAFAIIDKGGDSTHITFFNMIINSAPRKELFE